MPAPRSAPTRLDGAFAALGDPTRRAIVARLAAEGEAGFAELARPFAISPPAVVKHLRVLEAAGLVRKEGPRARPVYRLDPEALAAPRDWLAGLARFWEDSFDRLEEHLDALPPSDPEAPAP